MELLSRIEFDQIPFSNVASTAPCPSDSVSQKQTRALVKTDRAKGGIWELAEIALEPMIKLRIIGDIPMLVITEIALEPTIKLAYVIENQELGISDLREKKDTTSESKRRQSCLDPFHATTALHNQLLCPRITSSLPPSFQV